MVPWCPVNTATTPVIRRTVAALTLAAVLAGCGGGDSDDDGQPVETDVDDGASPECRTEIVEDEYGFEVEVEVCDE